MFDQERSIVDTEKAVRSRGSRPALRAVLLLGGTALTTLVAWLISASMASAEELPGIDLSTPVDGTALVDELPAPQARTLVAEIVEKASREVDVAAEAVNDDTAGLPAASDLRLPQSGADLASGQQTLGWLAATPLPGPPAALKDRLPLVGSVSHTVDTSDTVGSPADVRPYTVAGTSVEHLADAEPVSTGRDGSARGIDRGRRDITGPSWARTGPVRPGTAHEPSPLPADSRDRGWLPVSTPVGGCTLCVTGHGPANSSGSGSGGSSWPGGAVYHADSGAPGVPAPQSLGVCTPSSSSLAPECSLRQPGVTPD